MTTKMRPMTKLALWTERQSALRSKSYRESKDTDPFAILISKALLLISTQSYVPFEPLEGKRRGFDCSADDKSSATQGIFGRCLSASG